jgi:hypothetical protein
MKLEPAFMLRRKTSELGSTGSPDTSRFHALSGGKTAQPRIEGPAPAAGEALATGPAPDVGAGLAAGPPPPHAASDTALTTAIARADMSNESIRSFFSSA